MKITSQAWSKFIENTLMWLEFAKRNLIRLVTSFNGFKIIATEGGIIYLGEQEVTRGVLK